MGIYKRLSVAAKIVLLSAFLALVFLGTTFGFVLYESYNTLLENSLDVLEIEVSRAESTINSKLTFVNQTVVALSQTPPVQGIVRARNNGGFDELEQSSFEQWQKRLGTIFVSVINSQGLYGQLRYIDAVGNEIVRVNNINGVASIAEEGDLQYKGNRQYIINAQFLPVGEVYVSDVSLNREGAESIISEPPTPIVHYVVPVFDTETDQAAGFIVANVLFNEIVSFEGVLESDFIAQYIFDSAGYFYQHPDVSKEWGGPNDYNSGAIVQNEFSNLFELAKTQVSGSIVDGGNVFVFSRVTVDSESGRYFVLTEQIKERELFDPINQIIIGSGIVAFISFLTLLILYIFVIGKILSPLNQMRRIAEKMGKGDFSELVQVTARDEIGNLGEAINTMSSELQSLYSDLEKKVNQKTKELADKVDELEKTKTATLNLLEDLNDQQLRLDLAKRAAGIGIWELDIKTNRLVWDERMYELYGVRKEDFSGAYDAWQKGLHPDDRKESEKALESAIKNKEPFDTTFRVKWPDGTVRYIKASGLVSYDEAGEPASMVGMNWDVTREKELDKVKSNFVSIASHQLRTPMTAIRWVVERFQKKEKLTERGRSYLNDIHTSVSQLAELVDSLLNVSRIESEGGVGVHPQDLDAVKFVSDYLGETAPLVEGKNLTLTFDDHPDSLPMETDPIILRNVVQSLVSNALEYTPEGGSVTVSLKKSDDWAIFSVVDTGIGIPKADQENMFEKFYRADNAKLTKPDGSGLGLYITREATRLLGGEITFESEEGKGTTFTVLLPLISKTHEGEKTLLTS